MSASRDTVHPISEEERVEAKKAGAGAFNRAVSASPWSNAEVGAMFGVSKTRIVSFRSTDKDDLDRVPSIADLILADHELGERLLQEIRVERLRRHGAPPTVTAEQKLHRAMSAASTFCAVGNEALEDGVLESHEIPGVEQARVAAAQQIDDVGVMFRGRKDLIK